MGIPSDYPPFANDRTQRVGPFLHQIGDIKDLVAQPCIVDRPTRSQHVVADGLAVELRFVDPERADVKPC